MGTNRKTTLVVNLTRKAEVVQIITKDGKKDSINVLSRANLPAGATVCPNYKAVHGKKLKIHAPEVSAAVTTPAPTQAQAVATSVSSTSTSTSNVTTAPTVTANKSEA